MKLQPMSAGDKAKMDVLFEYILGGIKDVDAGLVVSVLSQLLVQGIPGEDAAVPEEVVKARCSAMLGVLNIMAGGLADKPFDQAGLAESVGDLTSIAKVGSRALMVPALVYTLVSAICNGRRSHAHEEVACQAIRDALIRLEAELQ